MIIFDNPINGQVNLHAVTSSKISSVFWKNNNFYLIVDVNDDIYVLQASTLHTVCHKIQNHKYSHVCKNNKNQYLITCYLLTNIHCGRCKVIPDDVTLDFDLWINHDRNKNETTYLQNRSTSKCYCENNILISTKYQSTDGFPGTLKNIMKNMDGDDIVIYNYLTQEAKCFPVDKNVYNNCLNVSISPDESLAVVVTREQIIFFDL